MLDPKDVMMQLEEEAVMAFEDEHGREPNSIELQRIQTQSYEGIGDYYADIGDHARDVAKGN